MCAVQSCLVPILEMLLDEDDGLGVHPNLASSGQTILHLAAEFDNYAAIGCLIRHGADPLKRDNERRLPVHVAAADATAITVAALLKETGDAAEQFAEDRVDELRRQKREELIKLRKELEQQARLTDATRGL